jgi:hypothetical protein
MIVLDPIFQRCRHDYVLQGIRMTATFLGCMSKQSSSQMGYGTGWDIQPGRWEAGGALSGFQRSTCELSRKGARRSSHRGAIHVMAASSIGVSGPCCFSGHVASGQPTGSFVKIGGVETYLAVPEVRRVGLMQWSFVWETPVRAAFGIG